MSKVLVIDDDVRIAQSLSIRLKSAGYEVVMANDGLEAVAAAVRERPDLAVLDISMPAGDGFSVVERFQANTETMGMPFIFITASRRPSFRERAKKLGASGYFEKPYVSADLLECVRTTLEPVS